jgi:hypothetical protein
MPELGAGTQGLGKYCERVSRWIAPPWKGEIPPIIELPFVFSVEISGPSKIEWVFPDRDTGRSVPMIGGMEFQC